MNMLRKRVFISSIITLLFLVLTNNFWLVKKPVDLQFELTGADNISISYKLHGNVFSSKMVSKDFDLKISPKIKISNNNLIFFNKVETLVDTGFSGGG